MSAFEQTELDYLSGERRLGGRKRVSSTELGIGRS